MMLIAVVLLLLIPLPALALPEETWICWSENVYDSVYGDDKTITRCKIAGSEIVDYDEAAGESPPVVLSPMVGADAGGTCWYWTSQPSPWVILGFAEDGNAILGYDPDGQVGGPIIIQGVERICTSEPVEVPPPEVEAYELLSAYVHPPPEPEVNPPPGRGIAGMETFVALDPPEPWSDSLVSPLTGRTIEVQTWVDAVQIEWGDGTETVIPRELLSRLTGYPDGIEPHIYEAKTCEDPTQPRCHPELSAYPLAVRYLWQAQYRVDGGGWQPLVVDPTETLVEYPVAEIIGLITDTG